MSLRLSPPLLIAALSSLLVLPAPAVAAPCSTTGSPEFSVDLAGQTWKFRTGDDVAWAAPGFDDSAWESRVVPDNWNTTAESNYDGFAWYRIAFTLPERPANLPDSAVIASLGFIDDADTSYLNGTRSVRPARSRPPSTPRGTSRASTTRPTACCAGASAT